MPKRIETQKENGKKHAAKKEKTTEEKPKTQVAEDKRKKEKKVLKKIEDFNKFTRLRAVKEVKRRKDIAELVKLEPIQVGKAIKALQVFKKKQTEQSRLLLEDEDEFLYVEITLNHLPEEYTIRPFPMQPHSKKSKLPVPIYSEAYFSKHCIFVKDQEEPFKQKIQDLNIPCIGEAIGYHRLVKEYNTFEEKRKLCKSFDLFFCDYRIYDLMRKPTGKVFYDRKK